VIVLFREREGGDTVGARPADTADIGQRAARDGRARPTIPEQYRTGTYRDAGATRNAPTTHPRTIIAGGHKRRAPP